MKRILYIPLDYSRHKEDDMLFGSMLKALQKQCEAMLFNDMDVAIDFKSDIILYQGSLTNYELANLKEQTGAMVAMWTGDARYAPVQSLMEMKDIVNVYFLPFSANLLTRYSKILQRPCRFIWEPIQDWRFKEPKEMQGGRTVFVGNGYETLPGGRGRTEIISFLKERIPDFDVYGSINQSEGIIDYKDVPGKYNDSYLVIAENNMNDIDDYFTPRNIGAMAAGSCCLMRTFPGIGLLFSDFDNCVFYKHKYELLDVINFLKDNPGIRNRTALRGYQYVKSNFTCDNWVKTFLSICAEQ